MEDIEKFETLEAKSTWGGVRPNSGRPKGSENPETKRRNKIERAMKKRILKSVDNLITSQMTLAKGVQMLYVITTNEKGIRSKPTIVTDKYLIEKFLAGELEGEKEEYYFITTERPDNRALDSLLDRIFGKAHQSTTIKGDIDNPVIIQVSQEAIDKYKLYATTPGPSGDI